MIHLDLTEDEAQVLRDFLATALGNLSYEIADTDSKDFRDGLKAKRDTLIKLQEALSAD